MMAVLKTAAVYQMVVMLDEWDEDNELAPLESFAEIAGWTSTFFAYCTFGSHLGGAASGMLHREK